MVKSIDHIGIGVKNLDEAVRLYRDVLGFKLEAIHVVKKRKVKIAFLSAGGETRIELVEPLDNESFMAKFIAEHGEGIHHVAVKVGNLDAALKELEGKGLTFVDTLPRMGVGGVRIAFVQSQGNGNVLFELRETV